jgi:phospholipid transport system substrate-binding protein
MKTLRRPIALCLASLALALALPAVAAEPAALPAGAAAPVSEANPQDLINEVSKRLFAALESSRTTIHKHPEAIYPIVDQILLPHFDAEYATQLVLAQHWREASPEQRQRFIEAFHSALLRTYGGALTDVTADRVRLLPYRGEPGAEQATVHTEVTRDNGALVHVDYRLHRTAEGWKAFDVVIEGISYVHSYRTDLDSEIASKGLDSVIERMKTHALTAS